MNKRKVHQELLGRMGNTYSKRSTALPKGELELWGFGEGFAREVDWDLGLREMSSDKSGDPGPKASIAL